MKEALKQTALAVILALVIVYGGLIGIAYFLGML